ncbi:MAG: hypothetical protein IPG07_17300 [Crocinitomicaceae bacterium]|nr:hypothetical protein [Crocinitomicaceae bacterium]
MRIYVDLLLLLLVFSSCTVSNGEVQEDTSLKRVVDNDFLSLVRSSPKIELPFSMYCEDCCGQQADAVLSKKMGSYLPEGSSLIGVIMQTDSLVVLLASYAADWIIPAVTVHNLSGDLIDEKVFMGEWCGTDFGYFGKQYFTISQDFVFTEIDTSFTFLMDSVTYDIIDTLRTEIVHTKFVISNSGILLEEK